MKLKKGEQISFPNGTLLEYVDEWITHRHKRTLNRWVKECRAVNKISDKDFEIRIRLCAEVFKI